MFLNNIITDRQSYKKRWLNIESTYARRVEDNKGTMNLNKVLMRPFHFMPTFTKEKGEK
jgi:uncharacterized protein YbbC (DUF1343 family)